MGEVWTVVAVKYQYNGWIFDSLRRSRLRNGQGIFACSEEGIVLTFRNI
jgi:hypothetical protein